MLPLTGTKNGRSKRGGSGSAIGTARSANENETGIGIATVRGNGIGIGVGVTAAGKKTRDATLTGIGITTEIGNEIAIVGAVIGGVTGAGLGRGPGTAIPEGGDHHGHARLPGERGKRCLMFRLHREHNCRKDSRPPALEYLRRQPPCLLLRLQ